MMWINPTTLGDVDRGLWQHFLAGDNSRSARILTNGRVLMGDGANAVSAPLVPGYWTHLAFVFEGGDVTRLYVDGVLVAEVVGETPSVSGSGAITLGKMDSESIGFAGT